jgi:hypothetical protein
MGASQMFKYRFRHCERNVSEACPIGHNEAKQSPSPSYRDCFISLRYIRNDSLNFSGFSKLRCFLSNYLLFYLTWKKRIKSNIFV